MKVTQKPGKTCEKCGSQNFKTHLATYPVKLETKQINIGRVSVKECMDCNALTPTKAGQEKITRCMMTMACMSLLGDD